MNKGLLPGAVSRRLYLLLLPMFLVAAINLWLILLLNHQMESDAHILNFSGLVRGSMQLLVKRELCGHPADPLLHEITDMIHAFRDGKSEYVLRGAETAFSFSFVHLESQWLALQEAIMALRVNPSDANRHRLLGLSDEAWETTNEIVFSAQSVVDGRKRIVFIVVLLGLLDTGALLLTLFLVRKYVTRQLEQHAHYDVLTGCLNRQSYGVILADKLAQAERYALHFSLICFDLDHFKQVNDRFGHSTGDQVLRQVTRVVASVLRETDRLFRLGGEEFGILAPHTRRDGAMELAERVRKAVEETVCPGPGRVTISLGVAEWSPGMSVEALYSRADGLLYQAKGEGRNRVEG